MSLSLFAIFGAGLLTFASPCVLPLMPIYLAMVVGVSLEQARMSRTLMAAAAFSFGLMLVFVTLGALASSLGALLSAHRAAIAAISGGLMIVFGLRGLGLLRSSLLERDVRPALTRIQTTSSVTGSFFFGGAFALGWSPCIGPVLASVLTYAAANAATPLKGAGYLAVYALGLVLPLMVLAAVAARAANLVKRIGRVVPVLEKATGALLVGLGVWTLSAVLAPIYTNDNMHDLARLEGEPAAGSSTATACSEGHGHTCALPQQVARERPKAIKAATQGRIVNFTADECPVCQRMKPVLDRLLMACSEIQPRFVQVDVAQSDGRALADEHAVRGTPTLLLFNEQGSEKARLLGEMSQEEMATAIEQVYGVSCWG